MNQNNQVVTNNNVQLDEDKVLRVHRKVRKLPFIFLFLLSISVLSYGIYKSLECKNKYDNYIIIGADLFRTNKSYQAGKPYYTGVYRYVVDGKKYTYNYSKKFEINPDNVIQIRYNPKNPAELYSDRETFFYIIIAASGGLVFLITFLVLISLTSKKDEKIVVCEVFDSATCVGGRKIYFKTFNLDGTPLKPEEVEYYSYYTDKYDLFPVGKRVKFNLYKYKKSYLTENFNDIVTIQINDLKFEDFIFLN